MINAATNLVRERLFASCISRVGFRVIFYLWLLESCGSVQEKWRWKTNWSSWSDTNLCEIVILLIVSDSLRLSFDQFLPISGLPGPARCQVLSICLSKSPWRLKRARRVETGRGEGGEFVAFLLGEFEDREEQWAVSSLPLLSLWLPAARCWGHTENLTNGLRSTDNLILWHIINYDSLSIVIMTS